MTRYKITKLSKNGIDTYNNSHNATPVGQLMNYLNISSKWISELITWHIIRHQLLPAVSAMQDIWAETTWREYWRRQHASQSGCDVAEHKELLPVDILTHGSQTTDQDPVTSSVVWHKLQGNVVLRQILNWWRLHDVKLQLHCHDTANNAILMLNVETALLIWTNHFRLCHLLVVWFHYIILQINWIVL